MLTRDWPGWHIIAAVCALIIGLAWGLMRIGAP